MAVQPQINPLKYKCHFSGKFQLIYPTIGVINPVLIEFFKQKASLIFNLLYHITSSNYSVILLL